MKLLATALLAAAFFTGAASLHAQTAVFTDPANLRGERVRPRDGRELPIDGGEGNNALGLQQLLRKLQTRASILNIVAHPDDEDGGMMAFYSRGFGARVADLSLTRGEGGQNAATGDFEDALGLLRTQELLANDRYTGVDQFFGTEVDFGFSKTKAEAFSKWTHERVLYDAVRAIRLYRPLVITSTWVGAATDGHGQHQVAGQIAQEAFTAAGDSKVFPELEKEGILPWQPLRIYARVSQQSIGEKGLFDYATGQFVPAEFTNYVSGLKSSASPSVDVVVHEGQTDSLLTTAAAHVADLPPALAKSGSATPLSYVQFARIGLGLQRSQVGPGVRNASAGRYDTPYHLYGDRTPAKARESDATFFTGIDTSLASIASLAPGAPSILRTELAAIEEEITAASSALSTQNASGVAPHLAEALSRTSQLVAKIDGASLLSPTAKENVLHELRIKRSQLNDALALALNLHFEATVHGTDLVVDSRPVVTTDLRTSSATPLHVTHEWLENTAGTPRDADTRGDRTLEVSADRHVTRTLHSAPLPDFSEHGIQSQNNLSLVVTRPYFTRDSVENPVDRLLSPSLRNAPQAPPALTAWATVSYKGVPVTLGRVVHDGEQPVRFVPPANLSLQAHAQVLPRNQRSFELMVHGAAPPAYASTTVAPYAIKIQVPPGWSVSQPGPLQAQGRFQIQTPAQWNAPVTLRAEATSRTTHHSLSEGYRPVGYGSLPRINYYVPATNRIVRTDINLPSHRRIGYVPGTGDDVAEALASIGLASDLLTVADLTSGKLAKYDTVILGVRTYNAHPDLHGAPTHALFDFARNGGNVVVQYQTGEFTAADAPYPLALGSNEKVVDETAPVVLTPHADPLLSAPNRITPADFNGWVEERGHGFLSTWDDHYTALTETHDPGAPAEHVAPQAPQRGGLITTPLGKGRWTYCAFALYRQLPEAVPGAFRLFVNLLQP